jgi:MFS-type transporter involved in bile tolerance (Atg22 family)
MSATSTLVAACMYHNLRERDFQKCFSYVSFCSLLVTLLRPEHKNRFYIFAVFWGMSIGWMHPQHITAFSSMITSGQEAELMGILLFSVICLEWMPPLVFSAFNEAGFPMSWGLASLGIFFFIAIIFNLAVAFVNRSWLVSSTQDPRGNNHKSNASTLLPENQATSEIREESNHEIY